MTKARLRITVAVAALAAVVACIFAASALALPPVLSHDYYSSADQVLPVGCDAWANVYSNNIPSYPTPSGSVALQYRIHGSGDPFTTSPTPLYLTGTPTLMILNIGNTAATLDFQWVYTDGTGSYTSVGTRSHPGPLVIQWTGSGTCPH